MNRVHSFRSMTATGDLKRAALWTAIAAIAGYSIPAIFSSGLRWERGPFLIPYLVMIAAFLTVFFHRGGFALREFTRSWPFGVVGAAIVGYYVVQNIHAQPASAVPSGADLAWALLWFGVVYGVADALFLNVFPVLAFHGPDFDDLKPGWRRRLLRGALAILASICITAAYHLGFAEYHNASLIFPLIGNIIITASYVVTRSPLAAIGSHTAMHVAGVLHGMETVMQLPPHY